MNTVLMPKWMRRTLFLPNDATFKVTMCPKFVLAPEGMERNKQDVHKSHHILHVLSPPGDN